MPDLLEHVDSHQRGKYTVHTSVLKLSLVYGIKSLVNNYYNSHVHSGNKTIEIAPQNEGK